MRVWQPRYDGRFKAVASVDATTMRDWALNVAPSEHRFRHVMPCLPWMSFDHDLFYGMIAPRPLIVTRLQTGWPRSGFEQVTLQPPRPPTNRIMPKTRC